MSTDGLRKINLTTPPGEMVSFSIDNDIGATVFVAGGYDGKIDISNNIVHYTPNSDFHGVEILNCQTVKDGLAIEILVSINVGYPFKAKSHILSLLGDELIGSDNLAIFELVKNSYDADATIVTISFKDLNTPHQSIVIEDNGTGMTLEILRDVWLEIGTDFKRGKKRTLSNKFRRVSLGEKGVGRLAVHKLGKSIILETQPEGSETSYALNLNWQKLIDDFEYINQTSVPIVKSTSKFKEGHGTRITISDLKKETWTRGELRELARKTNSIITPFKEVKGSFDVTINAGGNQDWIADIKKIDTLLNDAVYYFDFSLARNPKSSFASLKWNYKFTPPKSFELKLRSFSHPAQDKIEKSTDDLHSDVFDIKPDKEGILFATDQKHLKNTDLDGIGEITGRFYVYNLLSVVLKAFGQTQAIKDFVRDNSGVKIFRDGIRVYNYGEPSDDWLGLDLARVQRLGSHFSKNTTIGSIEITQEGSFQNLKEKTNREGFDENHTFLKFKSICDQVFRLFETVAQKDRDALKDSLEGLKPVRSIGLPDTLRELKEKLKDKDIDREVGPLLKRVEKDYNDMRDVMLNSGMTGINLGIVFHEVDREIRFINTDLKNNVSIDGIKQRVKNLLQLLESFAPILRQHVNIKISASNLVNRAKQINDPRFKYHGVLLSSPLLTGETADFEITGPGNLLISAISNIIDNSIYWVTNRRELETSSYKPAIYIGTDLQNFHGPAIIVGDNGNGFRLEPEDLIMPYRTTRPGGMGLGLYFVNLVMELIGGKLVFPEQNEVTILPGYTGAIVALIFPKP